MTGFTFNFHGAVDQRSFKEQFVALLTTIFFETTYLSCRLNHTGILVLYMRSAKRFFC